MKMTQMYISFSFVLNTLIRTLFQLPCECSLIVFFFFFSPDPSKPGQPRPAVVADSEVYKMLKENQESDEPPRQSASFKVLQEILETGTTPLTVHVLYSQHECVNVFVLLQLPLGWMLCGFYSF